MNNSSLENESLTQDSLFINPKTLREEAHHTSAQGGAFRAALTKTPAAQMATTTSSQFRTLGAVAGEIESSAAADINIRDSNLMVSAKKRISLAENLVEGSGPSLANAAAGGACTRTLKPSQRNKVIMTRSVDH